MSDAGSRKFPHIFSPIKIRNTIIPNRIGFAPTCPTWVNNPYEGRFTDQAVAYYEERAKGGVGMIVIGGTLISTDTLYTPLLFPGLWEDGQIDGLAAIVDAVHEYGTKISTQLLHVGLRSPSTLKTDSAYDPEARWFMSGPSQIPPAEYPGAPMPKELEESEILKILDDYEAAADRARRAGLDGIELNHAHGYLPWQFLSPLYNQRTDRWGGSFENRIRFTTEVLKRMRAGIGDDAMLGLRINSTAFQEGDLEIDDVTKVIADLDARLDVDYFSLSAGVHHSFIHTPMTYEQGWERKYTQAVKQVTDKPVMLVGRYQTPGPADEAIAAGDGDMVLLARQLFAEPDWVNKVKEDSEEDIRRCVAANLCWRSVITGGRVQCMYNPTVGREAAWGKDTVVPVEDPKRVLVLGGGPAGLEFARVAAAMGNDVVLCEREQQAGGHTRAYAALPHRGEYGRIGTWLYEQATKNGADIRLGADVTVDNLPSLTAEVRPDLVVVATGARYRRDGFQGQTGRPLPGHETGRCVAWDEVALGKVVPEGKVLVIDDLQDVAAPLTAVKLAESGVDVSILTRWPSIAMETAADVYLHWMMTYVYQAGVGIEVDQFVTRIAGDRVDTVNVYDQARTAEFAADWIVMATGRASRNELYHALRDGDIPVEMIGCAVAPRSVREATFEGHRAARRLSGNGAPALALTT